MKKVPFINCSFLILLQTKMAFVLGQLIDRILNNKNAQEADLPNVKKVLVLKTDEIGDFILATAFLRELRLMLPTAKITLVVNPAIYNLAALCPYVDDIIIFNTKIPRYARPFILPLRAFKLGYFTLRPKHFDIALMPRWDMDTYYSTYIAYFSFSKRRIGYTEHVNSRKQIVNKGYDLLLTDAIHDERPKHEVERYLDLIRHLGGNPSSDVTELWIDPEDDDFGDGMLSKMSSKMLIAFCPGAGKANRQWPANKFVELGQWLTSAYDSSLIIVGGPADVNASRLIKEAIGNGIIDFTGKTTLRQTISLLKRCHLYVGNDTGSMHLAAAAGVPVVEISCFPGDGPIWHWNSPGRFGPWKVPHKILQPGKCLENTPDTFLGKHLDRIHEISVRQAQDAIHDLFPTPNH